MNFDFGSDKIKPECYGYLEELLNVLKQTGAKIKVKGHTDNVGS
ncbi:MAG: OmpA family protein [Bacteroidales bacterium]|nr:OmpA family protein [Bacteroidales bacterium]